MKNENKQKKLLMTSLSALLFGVIFFIFGISIKISILPFVVNYVISAFLFISAYLAVHNNNKEKVKLFTYIECLSIFFIIFITIVLVLELL